MKQLICRVTAFFLLVFFLFIPQSVLADFSNATVRPERNKVSSVPLPVLITATVSSVGVTEDQVAVTISNLWTISSVASSYTVSTSGLPSGITAWPGIGTAVQKSGQTVVFPSGDLSVGITYGFYITGGITNNPSTQGSSSEYIWQLETRQGGSQVDLVDIVVPVVSNDQIVVTGQVLPPISDFSAVISTQDSVTQIPQNTQIEYVITYGTEYDFSTPLTIVAEWEQGTIFGAGSPSVDLFEYVAGSATDAYNNTEPVINLTNRTITWTISAIPGNTQNQTVSFILKTTAQYTGSSEVTAQVNSRITNPVTTTDSTSEVSYKYVSSSSGSSTSNTGSTPTPTSSPAASTTSQTAVTTTASSGYVSYKIVAVESTSAELQVILNTPGTLTATVYSVDGTKLEVFESLQIQKVHSLVLDNLFPDKEYHVLLSSIQNGVQSSSERLAFLTASDSYPVTLTSFTVSSKGKPIFSPSLGDPEYLLIPAGSELEVILPLLEGFDTKSVTLYLQTITDIDLGLVLGESQYGSQISQIQNGIWSGSLTIPHIPGKYQVYLTLESFAGSKKNISLGKLLVVQPFSVYDSASKLPIERAKVNIKKYNETTKLYDFFEKYVTNSAGSIDIIFPKGKYFIEVESTGYVPQSLEFDTTNATFYPQLYLEKEYFPYFKTVEYHVETAKIKTELFVTFLKKESESHATLTLITLLTLCITTPLTLFGFLTRSHFSVRTLLHSVLHHHRFIFSKKKTLVVGGSQYYKIKLVDTQTERLVRNAVVTVQDSAGQIKSLIQVHRNGLVFVPKSLDEALTASVVAPGYAPQSIDLKPEVEESTLLKLEKESAQKSYFSLVISLLKHFLDSALEINLLLSLVTAILFVFVYEKHYAIPFLVLSLGNFLLYLNTEISVYLHEIHFSAKK